MVDSIVSIAHTQRRARAAFERGDPRDAHGLNWHADALVHWLAEYDRLAKSQQSHGAPAGRGCVELAQGVA